MRYYVKSYDEVPEEWIYANTTENIRLYIINGIAHLVPDLQYLSYRKNELHPEIYELLKTAFLQKEKIIYHSNIDTIIKFQEYCLEKAKRYIGYMWLGTHSYLDVFGEKAKEYFEELRTEQREVQKMVQLDRMESQIKDLQTQLWEMQKLIVNMAKQQNKEFSKTTTKKYKAI